MQCNKHVWSLFLHILPYFNQIRTENTAKTLKYPFSWTLKRRHSVIAVLKQKHRRNDQSGPQPDMNIDFRSFDNGLKQLYE